MYSTTDTNNTRTHTGLLQYYYMNTTCTGMPPTRRRGLTLNPTPPAHIQYCYTKLPSLLSVFFSTDATEEPARTTDYL